MIDHSHNHQTFVQRVAEIALARLNADERAKMDCKITYGAGRRGLRGVTYYGAWNASQADAAQHDHSTCAAAQRGHGEHAHHADAETAVPLVEICAFGEQDAVQLAGTTIHELGHVLAGFGAAHGKGWKRACERLGLRRCKAAGNVYMMAQFAPDIRAAIAELPRPADGKPVGAHSPATGLAVKPAPCPAGIGARGGKSRGQGSGSRLRLWQCQCNKPLKIRVASDDVDITCNKCGERFTLIK